MQEMQDKRGSIPGSGRSLGGGNGNPLQYSGLGNPMDRGAWRATVHRVTKSQTQLNRLSKHAHIIYIGLRQRLILQNSCYDSKPYLFPGQRLSFILLLARCDWSTARRLPRVSVGSERDPPAWLCGTSCCADPSFTLRYRSHAGSLGAPV